MTPGIQAPFFLVLLLFLGLEAHSSNPTSSVATGPASSSASAPGPGSTPSPATGPASSSASAPGPGSTPSPATGPASSSASPPGPGSTPSPATGPASSSATSPLHGASSSLATGPVHSATSSLATGPMSNSAATPSHKGTSAKATTIPAGKDTPSSVPSHHSDTPTTSASHRTRTTVSSTNGSTVPLTSPNHRISFFLLSFHILNRPFNSSLEDPRTNYYQELQRNITELFLQIYAPDNFLGSSNVNFRPGSVVVESILAFRDSTTSGDNIKAQFVRQLHEAAKYNLDISGISADKVSYPSSARFGPGVPGWGIALLVLVCVLVVLAIVYLVALAACQCRRKNCGQLDIFPNQDAYHPMSDYPTYHTHGRYVAPGSTKRSPYEEVSAGNGGSSLSYMNPAATSANL
ncbi:mucin-1 [Sturnira hondurensis]|uniref:mucin-1 n=1 Tax=Sturnira hondurensis TaxID=192404 RepID=UPI001878FF68|nr:mucin-1 [Sturnira hondurensis]